MDRRKKEYDRERKRVARQSQVQDVHEESFHGLNPNSVLDGYLDVQVVDYVSQILRVQFDTSNGLLTPSYLYGHQLAQQPSSIVKIPQDEFAVQIHIIPGHFLVSAQIDGSLFVIDSLPDEDHLAAVQGQLNKIYEESVLSHMKYISLQSQGTTDLCGFFAIATAHSLLSKRQLTNSKYDISSMRVHLRQCIINGNITSFPPETKGLMDNYFSHQKHMTEIHLKKSNPDRSKMNQFERAKTEKRKLHEKDKIQHQLKQTKLDDPEKIKLQEKNKEKQRRHRNKLNEIEKREHRQKDSSRHRLQRNKLDENEKSELRQKDKSQHQLKRNKLDENEKRERQQKDKSQHQLKRNKLDENEKRERQQKDKSQHRLKRNKLDENEKRERQQKDKSQHQLKRNKLDENEKRERQQKDKSQHQLKRNKLDENEKRERQQKDKSQHRLKRNKLDENEKRERQQKDKSQHRLKRQTCNKEANDKFKAHESECRQIKRQSLRMQKSNLLASYSAGLPTGHQAVNSVLEKFFISIKEGPTYVCCCCMRYLYKSAVRKLNDNIAECAAKLKLTMISTVKQTSWICDTCCRTIQKNKIPAQAMSNHLDVEKVPTELQNLCNVEKQLIGKIIPFMKIMYLPAGSQHGLKGQVVLVPSNIEKITTALPRQTADSQIIALNLKRRLSDKYGVSKQYIRPNVVNTALKCLQNINRHYANVTQNEDWTMQSESTDKELWNSVSQCEDTSLTSSEVSDTDIHGETSESELCHVEKEDDNSKPMIDSEDEVDDDNPLDVVEDLDYKRSLNSVTCIYPEYGPSVRKDQVLNVAPGEGQIPVSHFFQKDWEALAFPTLFPTGSNVFHDEERQVSITPKKYAIVRLLSKDSRFAESAEYTFQCLHWIESTAVNDSISISLKKSRQSDLSVGQLQSRDQLQTLFKEDELFASFKKIRGTPQYWKEMQQNMLAKIRHYGTYTFFLSGSAADFHWPELIQIVAKQYGETYDIHFIENEMDKKTKRNWLARNPVTIARHIDYIFRKLWGNVILSGIHPVGQILNYDIRKEMQSRGTAHFHSAIHVRDAPLVDRDSDETIVKFIDKFISCAVPSDTEDEILANLVSSRQTHHHTRTCKKKKGLNCRFHYPKPPSESTIIARMPNDELTKVKIEQSRTIMKKVMDTLEQTGTAISLNDLLKAADVTPTEYTSALSTSMKRISIILKREPTETCVNPYNPIILTALRANMDIQFITDVWACVAYITSYMCKPERTMSDLMRNACKEANTVKDRLKNIGNTFLKCREVSQHEAIARILGLPLKETNTPVAFIPTGYEHQRTRLLKPPQTLQKMEHDDTDVFLPNILDKYSARPNSMENVCLAEFASNYTYCRPSSSATETIDEILNEEDIEENSKVITLKNELGKMQKRKRPIVLRDYPVSRERDSEKYFHRLLILYLPWRNENELKNGNTYEQMFESKQDIIKPSIEHYEPYLEEVQQADEMTTDCEHEMWDRLAPEAEISRDEEVADDAEYGLLDPDNLSPDQILHDTNQDELQEKTPRQKSLSTQTNIQPQAEYKTMFRSLNPKQRKIHDYIFKWCRKLSLATIQDEEPKPFHIFLSGGAGVGKSHVVHTVYQTAIRTLRKAGHTTDLPSVLLTAPTGKAAVNIGGTTLHSAFHLPVKKKEDRGLCKYRPPSASALNTMRARYCHLKILIIDEISMVGAQTFSNLNLIMQDIFENDTQFGGISILAVGDLLQLNPVAEKPVYKTADKGYSALASSVWEKFVLFELTEIHRQKGDPEFADILSRLREGKQTATDIKTLQNLEHNQLPSESVSIFLTNALKDNYNKEQLQKLPTPITTIKAKDSEKDLNTRRIQIPQITTTNTHETGGLMTEIDVALNARYMHTKNTDISDGLVNGATGTIMHLDIPAAKPLAGTLYVKFDDPNIGRQAKATSLYKDSVPIKAVSATFSVTEKSSTVYVERTQYPGTLAWGITVHKAQGSTFQEMIANMDFSDKQKSTMPGQIYTMLSRAKSMKGMQVKFFNESKVIINKSAIEEMQRLRDKCTLTCDQGFDVTDSQKYTIISYLNIRSLKQHHQDIEHEDVLTNSHVVCLCETRQTHYNKYPMKGMQCISKQTKHGCVMYSKTSPTADVDTSITSNLTLIEAQAVEICSVVIVSVYIPPSSPSHTVFEEFQVLIQNLQMKTDRTWLILGDFNLDNSKRIQLEKLARQYQLQQCVQDPTHELGSVLDLVFTNQENALVYNIPVCYSDHHVITVKLKYHPGIQDS